MPFTLDLSNRIEADKAAKMPDFDVTKRAESSVSKAVDVLNSTGDYPHPYAIVLSQRDGHHYLLAKVGHRANCKDALKQYQAVAAGLVYASPFKTKPQPQGHVLKEDALWVVTTGEDGLAIIWDAATGQCMVKFGHADTYLSNVAVSPNRSQLLTGTNDSIARIWDLKSGQRLVKFQGHGTGNLMSVAFSANGSKVLTSSVDGTAKLWDPKNGKCIHTFTQESGKPVYAMFSPKGEILTRSNMMAGSDTSQRLWNSSTGDLIHEYPGPGRPVVSKFSADGLTLMSVYEEEGVGTIVVHNVKIGQEIRSFKVRKRSRAHVDVGGQYAFSPDGALAASTREIQAGQETEMEKAETYMVKDVVDLWDPSTGEKLHTLDNPCGSITHVAFSPDSKKVLTANLSSIVCIFNASTGEKINEFTGMGQEGYFAPDCSSLLITPGSCTLFRTYTLDGKEIHCMQGHKANITTLAYSSPGYPWTY